MGNSRRREVIKYFLSSIGVLSLGNILGYKNQIESLFLESDGPVVYKLNIVFPDGKNLKDYEIEKHQWINQSSLNNLIGKYRSSGELISVSSKVESSSVMCRYFVFSSKNKFRAWRRDINRIGAIDSELQAQLNYKAAWSIQNFEHS